jgi:hypothetical protein
MFYWRNVTQVTIIFTPLRFKVLKHGQWENENDKDDTLLGHS